MTEKKSRVRRRHSAETREKMRQAKLGTKLSEEHKRNIGLGGRGKVLSEESRRRMSEAHKGKKMSEETKEKIRRANTGRRRTEESVRAQSLTTRGIPREKGRPCSDETRRKLSEAATAVWAKGRKRIIYPEAIRGIVADIKRRHMLTYNRKKSYVGNSPEVLRQIKLEYRRAVRNDVNAVVRAYDDGQRAMRKSEGE